MQLSIIAHRGQWTNAPENMARDKAAQNSPLAAIKAFTNGFGVEADLFPGHDGRPVVANAFPTTDDEAFWLRQLLIFKDKIAPDAPLALDPKMGQLRSSIAETLLNSTCLNYFFLSVENPSDAIWYGQNPGHIYRMFSDMNPFSDSAASAPLYKAATGVWIDDFGSISDYAQSEAMQTIASHLENGKDVTIASPDIFPWGLEQTASESGHKRYAYQTCLGVLKPLLADMAQHYPQRHIAVCTNFPAQARDILQP